MRSAFGRPCSRATNSVVTSLGGVPRAGDKPPPPSGHQACVVTAHIPIVGTTIPLFGQKQRSMAETGVSRMATRDNRAQYCWSFTRRRRRSARSRFRVADSCTRPRQGMQSERARQRARAWRHLRLRAEYHHLRPVGAVKGFEEGSGGPPRARAGSVSSVRAGAPRGGAAGAHGSATARTSAAAASAGGAGGPGCCRS